jgi:hypothetical protein
MRNLIVTKENRQPLEGGRVSFGEQYFSCRGGSYRTYEVRLSAKAAAYLEDGDELRWWDGPSELPYIACGGEIIKADGRRIQLRGSRDVGIDTGHPPRLTLKMRSRRGVTWEWDGKGGRSYQAVKAPWGTWYKFDHCPPGIWGVKSHEEFMTWATNAQVFDGKTEYISSNRRLHLVTRPKDQEGWISGSLTPQIKVIGDIATDEPLIL